MRVTPEEIIKMNELYLAYHNYSAVAREVGRAPSTVKRYIDPNYAHRAVCKKVKEVDWKALEETPIVDISTWEQLFLERNGNESILP